MSEISIIIPVYNVAEYVEQCLDSLYKQTFRDIELIIVNDCSTDNSIEIINNYVSKKSNSDIQTVIINLPENKGAGAARNEGIKAAKGKYICFVDPDDLVTDDYAEILHINIEKYKSNVLFANFYLYDDITKKIRPNTISKYFFSYNNEAAVIETTEDKKSFLQTSLFGGIWKNIYRRDFLLKNNIFFPEYYTAEDLVFIWNVAVLTDKIYFINKNIYYYRYNRKQSVTNTNKNFIDYKKNIQPVYKIKELLVSFNIYESYKDVIAYVFMDLLLLYLKNSGIKKPKFKEKEFKNSKILPLKYGLKFSLKSVEYYIYLKLYNSGVNPVLFIRFRETVKKILKIFL